MRLMTTAALLLFASSFGLAQDKPGPWSTYRGNPQRTGNTDGMAGPAEPKVLWAYSSKDHYVAAPVPAGANILFPGLGPFNRPNLAALPTGCHFHPRCAEALSRCVAEDPPDIHAGAGSVVRCWLHG